MHNAKNDKIVRWSFRKSTLRWLIAQTVGGQERSMYHDMKQFVTGEYWIAMIVRSQFSCSRGPIG